MAVAVALAVLPAAADARARHFFGHARCVEAGRSCPRQHGEVTMDVAHRRVRFLARVSCYSPDDAAAEEPVAEPIRMRLHGRHFSGSSNDTGLHIWVRGAVKRGRARGTVSMRWDISERPCRARGVKFRLKLARRPLWRAGTFSGKASCGKGCSDVGPWESPMRVEIDRTGRLSLAAEITCDEVDGTGDPDGGQHHRPFRLKHVALDWYGRFSVLKATHKHGADVTREAEGVARAKRVVGDLDYSEFRSDGGCEASPSLRARR